MENLFFWKVKIEKSKINWTLVIIFVIGSEFITTKSMKDSFLILNKLILNK